MDAPARDHREAVAVSDIFAIAQHSSNLVVHRMTRPGFASHDAEMDVYM